MDSYITVKSSAEYRFEEKKSVFIASVSRATNEKEALDFISSIKKKYSDAKHNVYAYSIRQNNIVRFSDDKEPQGTAGLPILEIIKKQEVNDCIIVVTRYFGGILLGTGGLSRAYSYAAKEALLQAGICEIDYFFLYKIDITYQDYEKLTRKLTELEAKIEKCDFLDNISIYIAIRERKSEQFIKEIFDFTNGRITPVKYSERLDYTDLS